MLKAVLNHPRVRKAVDDAAPHLAKAFLQTRGHARVADELTAALRKEGRAVLQDALALTEGGPRATLERVLVADISVGEQWEDRKARVGAALRLARADAELKEAYQVFLAHEHRATAWRAQGVLMLKLQEREAEAVLGRLPAGRRAQLEETARQIRDAGLKTGAHTQGDTQCGQCVRKLAPELRGGDCCSAMVYLGWDEVDAVFRVLLGERAPVIREFHGDYTRCGFVGEHGCVLPAGTRPTVCTAYYCGPYKEDLQRDARWEPLGQVLLELNEGRKAMNFRMKMARRFVLQESKLADAEHPMDFIWDRLRSSGAEIGATGERQDKSGRLKVVS